MNHKKYEWHTFRTLKNKAICSRKTFKTEGNKDKVKEQIDEFLKGCHHKTSCYQTSVNWNIFEIEVIILVDGTIHQQRKETNYIRDGIDYILKENIQQY